MAKVPLAVFAIKTDAVRNQALQQGFKGLGLSPGLRQTVKPLFSIR